MKKTWVAATAAACFVPAIAMAQPARPIAVIDAYYVAVADLEIEFDDLGDTVEIESDDGDGFGVKGRFDLTENLFLAGEYHSNDYDEFEVEGVGSGDVDAELTFIRAGLGFRFSEDLPFYVLGEAVNADFEIEGEGDDDTGFGIHAGLDAPVADALSLYGQVGYVDVGDVDGLEALGGVVFMFTPMIGAFADYRYTDFEGDDGDLTIGDFRVGVRIALQ